MSNKNKELVTFVFEEDPSVFWDGIIVEAGEGVLQASDVSMGMEPGWRKTQKRQLTITSLHPAYVGDS